MCIQQKPIDSLISVYTNISRAFTHKELCVVDKEHQSVLSDLCSLSVCVVGTKRTLQKHTQSNNPVNLAAKRLQSRTCSAQIESISISRAGSVQLREECCVCLCCDGVFFILLRFGYGWMIALYVCLDSLRRNAMHASCCGHNITTLKIQNRDPCWPITSTGCLQCGRKRTSL